MKAERRAVLVRAIGRGRLWLQTFARPLLKMCHRTEMQHPTSYTILLTFLTGSRVRRPKLISAAGRAAPRLSPCGECRRDLPSLVWPQIPLQSRSSLTLAWNRLSRTGPCQQQRPQNTAGQQQSHAKIETRQLVSENAEIGDGWWPEGRSPPHCNSLLSGKNKVILQF